MKKLFRYLKPYWFAILMMVVLEIGRASCRERV